MGRGTWYRWDAKATVEGCLTLDVNRLARWGALKSGAAGTLTFTDGRGGPVGSVGYRTVGRVLVLRYAANEEPVECPVTLQTTTPGFGGWRHWFTCPLAVDGVPCGRRAGKLHLRGRWFGCRHCHRLTYRSCQESHQAEHLFAAMGFGPDVARAYLERHR